MYWLSKLYETPTGARFITASKNCSTTLLSDVISKSFKMIFKHVESCYNKGTFCSSYKKLWVVENSFPIIEKINIINSRKRATKIFTYDFSFWNTS